jgi:tagatose-1,6-bisphosphate aldolase
MKEQKQVKYTDEEIIRILELLSYKARKASGEIYFVQESRKIKPMQSVSIKKMRDIFNVESIEEITDETEETEEVTTEVKEVKKTVKKPKKITKKAKAKKTKK